MKVSNQQHPDYSDLHIEKVSSRKPKYSKTKNPGFSGPGIKLRKEGVGVVFSGKKNGPVTPLLQWKYESSDAKGEKCSKKVRNESGDGDGVVFVSARKLAAGLWQLQKPEVCSGGESSGFEKRSCDLFGLKPGVGHVGDPFHCRRSERDETKDHFQSPHSVPGPKNGMLYKAESSLPLHNPAMEGATKWDPVGSKTSDEVYRFYGHMKHLEDQQISNASVVSALQTELEQARGRIDDLESERRSSKKKLEHFLGKLAEEKAAWRSREHEKVRAIIDDANSQLKREKKNRHRMEIVNSKLVNELAEAKVSAKRFMQDYEKERKARELMEQVCDELAKEIGEDKAEVEALKRESMKSREEVDEERRMLQMAEVWREERVQMKLVDAKLTLEDKYSQMSKLIADLEVFLSSRSATPDVMEMRKAELLLEAASLIKIQDIKEFSYEPPNSEDIFSVFEDLQNGETNEREIEQCHGYSPASHASKIHTVSPDSNGFNGSHVQRYSNGFYQNGDEDDDGSGWETVSQAEEQGSSYSPEGSDPSVNRMRRDSNVSGFGRKDWEENVGHDSPNTEISEICSISSKHSKKKASSITKLWRSSGDNYKIISVDGLKGSLSNGRLSNAGTTSPSRGRLSNGRMSHTGIFSPDHGSGEDGFSPQGLMGQWSSPDSGNPHITRGMKGCIEWPRGAQKNSLKAKLLEARMESQKLQLRQVLKQKI
ncbi:hypothetical protein IFM89_018263 [Coptis chinensis]|uniref:Uncharacterized protein n=1 Tax=Coptis chinensis TaxID=261450 RepID=A0A835GY68_9MAGN|nr:hypothetical protein IFM89_018263 [Coptis chinensis]